MPGGYGTTNWEAIRPTDASSVTNSPSQSAASRGSTTGCPSTARETDSSSSTPDAGRPMSMRLRRQTRNRHSKCSSTVPTVTRKRIVVEVAFSHWICDFSKAFLNAAHASGLRSISTIFSGSFR